MNTAEQLVVWEKTRDTVEAFQKSVEVTRRHHLTLIGSVATASSAIIGIAQESINAETMVYLLALVTIGLSVIFWGIECRQRQYLRVAAGVSRNLEKSLGLEADRNAVSIELERSRRHIENSRWGKLSAVAYDLIYLGPASGAVLAVWYISLNSGRLISWDSGRLTFSLIPWIWGIALTSFVIIYSYAMREMNRMAEVHVRDVFQLPAVQTGGDVEDRPNEDKPIAADNPDEQRGHPD